METNVTTNKNPVSVDFINPAPLLVLLGVAFESDDFESDVEEEAAAEAEVVVDSWPLLVGDVLEFESASLKNFASGEFGGRFNIPANMQTQKNKTKIAKLRIQIA